MAVGDRLRQARKKAGLTLEKAADSIGTSANTVWRYEAGQRQPSRLALLALGALYGKPYEWFFGHEEGLSPEQSPSIEPGRELADGERTMVTKLTKALPDEALATIVDFFNSVRDEQRQRPASRTQRESRYAVAQGPTPAIAESGAAWGADDETASLRPIEVNELAAAAGGGAEVYDETVVGRLWFRRDWLDHHAIDPKQCNVISVRGESMEPTLPNGCSILVDRSQSRRRRRVGRIFVLRTNDGLVVKRAGKDEEGRWQVVSDHPGWDPVPWADDTEVIGEVRWAARTF